MSRLSIVLLILVSSGACRGDGGGPRAPSPSRDAEAHSTWSAPIEPFRIVGNLYYVGAQNIASYLFATPAGHILLDTGSPEMIPVVRRNIEKLGFAVHDVKVLLSGHAHWDHVGGHAAMRRASGAQVMALGDDAAALEQGADRSPSASEGWEPVHVDRVLGDGDTVELGGTRLQAIWAPGHTPGCTVWTAQVIAPDAAQRAAPDAAPGGAPTRAYRVAFFACMQPGGDARLVGHPRFPNLVADTRASLRRLRALAPDFALLVHPAEQFAGKLAQLYAGAQPSPLYDPDAWRRFVDDSEAEFERRVAEETRAARQRE